MFIFHFLIFYFIFHLCCFTLPVQSLPITTIVEFNPAHGEMYSIQHYVMKLVGDLRQVDGFLWVFRCPPPIKLITTL